MNYKDNAALSFAIKKAIKLAEQNNKTYTDY